MHAVKSVLQFVQKFSLFFAVFMMSALAVFQIIEENGKTAYADRIHGVHFVDEGFKVLFAFTAGVF